MWRSFNIRPTFLCKISNNMLLNSCFVSWWCHKLWDLTSTIFLSNGLQKGKKGRRTYRNLNILSTKKAFQRKEGFSKFFKNYHLLRKRKITNTSFKAFLVQKTFCSVCENIKVLELDNSVLLHFFHK